MTEPELTDEQTADALAALHPDACDHCGVPHANPNSMVGCLERRIAKAEVDMRRYLSTDVWADGDVVLD